MGPTGPPHGGPLGISAEGRAVGAVGQHGRAARPGGVRFKARTSAVFFLVSELILDQMFINFDILGLILHNFSRGTPKGGPRAKIIEN